MTTAYTPPGVSVAEFSSPSVTPLLAVPASVCLVGLSSGAITRTDAITLTGTTAVTLPSVPVDATMASGAIIKVMDAINPSLAPAGYSGSTDYTFSNANHTIARQNTGIIPDGNTVYVTYTYTPADYFSPIRLDNLNDIQDRFGPAWDTAGATINSALSAAAQVAFENGASNVVLQPLFFLNAGVRQQPTSGQAAASATWQDNFTALRDIEDINIIVPVVGQSQASVNDSIMLSIEQDLQDHVKYMKDQQQYVIGIFGEDSSASSSVATDTILRTHATTIAARYGGEVTQQMVMAEPSKFTRPTPGSVGAVAVGGQYMAAAIAGMIAARDVAQTLTRKAVSGFQTVAVSQTKAQKNADAALGMLVVEQRGNIVQIRHAITMDTTSTPRRELSVVRSKHRVIESVRDTLETQVIGQVIADGDAPLFVATAVASVLEALRGTRDIVSYSDVQARTLQLDPTTVEVRFNYRPAFPINYINVVFSLDLTNQDVTVPSTTTVNNQSF